MTSRNPLKAGILAFPLLLLACAGVFADEGTISEDWISTEWEVWCPDAESPDVGPCDEHETAARVFKDYLESASEWFKGLGFKGPKVLNKHGRYQAYIVRAEDTYIEEGLHDLGRYSSTAKLIYLHEDYFFAMGEPVETMEAADLRLQHSFMYISVHELFHAIQYTYADNVCGEGRGWLCEGMANAALRAYADKFEPEVNVAMVARPYHEPLHQPSDRDWEYGTWRFWLEVGKRLNSTDRIRYLRNVMERNLGPRHGLLGVDYALKDIMTNESVDPEIYGTEGLYELLPWFFASRDPVGLFPAAPLRRTVRLAEEKSTIERMEKIIVPPVAGRHVELTVLKPAGERVAIRLSFAKPSEDLHLIVNKRRYDKVRGDDRNVFLEVDDEAREMKFDVVIANVAKLAIASEEAEVDLIIELLPEHAYIGVGGRGSGPAPADIGQPLPFEVTRWWFGHHTSAQMNAARLASEAPVPDNLCFVQLELVAEDVVGDEDISFGFYGTVPAPMAPGAWPVVSVGEKKDWGVFSVDGQMPCSLGGCSPPGPNHHKYRMTRMQGDIEWLDVSQTHLVGRFDVAGHPETRYASVHLTGAFHITVGGPGDRARTLREGHSCTPLPEDSTTGGYRHRPEQGRNRDHEGGTTGEDGTTVEGGTTGEGDTPGEGDDRERGGGVSLPDPNAREDADSEQEAAPDAPPSPQDPVTKEEGAEQAGRLGGWILEFQEDYRRSVLRSEPQVVHGTGSGTGVTLSSPSYDLTVALTTFGCTAQPADGASAAEMSRQILAYNRWMQSGRTVSGEVLFEFTAADLRLNTAGGDLIVNLESAEGHVRMRKSTGNGQSSIAADAETIGGAVPDLTIEVRRGEDTITCIEPMSVAFTASRTD